MNKFELKHKGFVQQTIEVVIQQSTRYADKLVITVNSDAPQDSGSEYFTELRNDLNPIREDFHYDEVYERWTDEFLGQSCTNIVDASKLEETIKHITQAFYDFHNKQDATAQNTINILRSFRIEDIISEDEWLVTKVTQRRGRRGGRRG
jgi:hypothetical protein